MIISQIIYGASIWHTPNVEKKNQKTLVTYLVQTQALGEQLITGAFKPTFV